jgi:hypothetical protein
MILDGQDFGPVEVIFADFAEPKGVGMFAGYTFFGQHVVCVDFAAHQFRIQH